MTVTRLLMMEDVPALAALYRANRDFLAPFEPVRPEEFYTNEGQRAAAESALARCKQGTMCPLVIFNEAGHVAGRININDIVRGAFQSGNLGYWVSARDNGRGLATAAIGETAAVAFGQLGLHRLQPAPCWTTPDRSGFSGATASRRSAWLLPTSISRGDGRTTCCSS